MAALFAVHFGFPCFCVLDNLGAASRAMAILAGRVGSKPWSLRRNGDIWQRFYRAVQGRDMGTCRFAW
eukprot:11599377-Alexandrium_andersonii.AAC.1